MESLDKIETLHMSGARAVFKLKPGSRLSEEDVATAFEDKGMKLEAFGEHRRPRAKWQYAVDAGIT